MTAFVFLVVSLAVWRITNLVTTDTITEPFRRRLIRRYPPHTVPLLDDAGRTRPGTGRLKASWPVEWIHCDWCVSVHASAAGWLVAHWCGYADRWTFILFAVPATAALCGLLSDVDGRLNR